MHAQEVLVLSFCNLGASAAERIGEGLSRNTSLKLLDLSGNALGDAQGAQPLATALSKR